MPVSTTGLGEFTAIADAFNNMQARLKRFVDERTQILAAVSHDLRTSLTRLAEAEYYLPLPLGSPLNYFGGDASKANQPLDGISFVPLLTETNAKLSRDAIYWHFPGYLGVGQNQWRTTPAGAIRVGDYKLIEFFEDGRLELYNLKEDLSQKKDLASSDPARTKAMHEQLVAWRKSVNATMPTPHTPDPNAKGKKRNRANADDE